MSFPLKRSRPQAQGSASTPVRLPHACPGGETAAERLTDDLLVEILARVPAKSVCRFKCVSKHWLGLICDPNHRKRLPQTLEGFFYGVGERKRKFFLESPVRFTNMSGRRRPPLDFTFLPNSRRVDLLDCCNGLLLCRWYDVSTTRADEFRYVVCNPATEEWLALPDSGHARNVDTARLGFDPVVSSHFHVFVLPEGDDDYDVFARVHVYSSETGRWIHKENGWNRNLEFRTFGSPAVFLDSYMHFCFLDSDEFRDCVAAVHTDGETWMSFDCPYSVELGSIQQSQGRLHYVGFGRDCDDVFNLVVVYVLEDYDSKSWVLKHTVDLAYIGRMTFSKFDWIAIHPDCNLIFFRMGQHIALMCHDMDHRQTKVIRNLGDGCPPYLPYVPLHAELKSLHMGRQ